MERPDLTGRNTEIRAIGGKDKTDWKDPILPNVANLTKVLGMRNYQG